MGSQRAAGGFPGGGQDCESDSPTGQENAGIHRPRLLGVPVPLRRLLMRTLCCLSPWKLQAGPAPSRGQGSQEEVLDQAKNLALSEGGEQVPEQKTSALTQERHRETGRDRDMEAESGVA